MARPKRGNYATGEAGQARYRKAVTEWLKKQKEAKAKATKITSTKKNIAKQKATAKKATTTAKVKELAKGTTSKPTPKKPVAKKPVAKTTTATKPAPKKTVTKTVTKKPATKKPAPKKPAPKKPVPKKPAGKVPAKKPLISNKQKLQIKKAATTAKTSATKTVKTLAKKAGEAKTAVTKKADQVKKTFKKSKAPRPTTPQQKAVSKVYKGAKQYGKKLLKKGGKDLLKIGKGIIKNPKSAGKGIVGGYVAGKAAQGINYAVDKGFQKITGRTKKEGKERLADIRKNPEKYERTLTGYRLKGSGTSSTRKNINKQKKANTTPNRGLKIKKTERSSRKNTNKDYNAPTATKKADKRFGTFREGSNENLKLQLERQKGNTETYSRKLSKQAKKTKSNKTTTTKAPRPGSARARLRAKNVERFGKAHVDRLVAKNKEFQAIKRIKNKEERRRRREAYRQKYGK